MSWWQTQPEAWAAHRTNLRDPAEAMPAYVAWLKALPGRPVFGKPCRHQDFVHLWQGAQSRGGVRLR